MALKRPKNSAMLKIKLHSFLGDGSLSLRVKPMLAAESALVTGRHLLSFTLLGFANLFHFQSLPICYTFKISQFGSLVPLVDSKEKRDSKMTLVMCCTLGTVRNIDLLGFSEKVKLLLSLIKIQMKS